MMHNSIEPAGERSNAARESVAEAGPEFRRKIDCAPPGDMSSTGRQTAPRGRGNAWREQAREGYHGRD